ncbi:LOW QUALITY PROTEIN: methylated-DNA-protein-cysteine methyltransferase [Bacillus sp. JCM 19045]|nr:LOW QUALITY PROTEIN: methylated-DNA-protein-cysteine methyltransferase [Bacillus sp. JCM 19045]
MSALKKFYVQRVEAPVGLLTIVATEQGVCQIHFGELKKAHVKCKIDSRHAEWVEQDTEFTQTAIQQLKEYFNGTRSSFTMELDLIGTPFQQRVWTELKTIGYGETKTYKEIAEGIGAPKAVRAVGGANNQNPLPIVIPCHRVIGSNGAMVGYGGGLTNKELLLSLESSVKIS